VIHYWRWAFLLLSLEVGMSSQALPQNNPLLFRHITMNDGLAGNDVRSIIQDDKGFMWLATDNGLQRFDGSSFTNYHHSPTDSQTISSDNLLALLKDKQNNIWAISFLTGFDRLDPISHKAIRVNNLNKNSFSDLFLGNAFCMDKKGNIWLIGAKGIACYISQTGELISYKNIFPRNFHPYFMDAKYDSINNQIWMADGYNGGVCMYDVEKNILYNRENNPGDLPIFKKDFYPTTLFIDREKNLWMNGYNGSLLKYNFLSKQFYSYNLYASSNGLLRLKDPIKSTRQSTIPITTFYADSRRNVWIASGPYGLVQYTPQKDSFSLIPSASMQPNGLAFNAVIHCLFEDREGNIWIGTDRGINIFNLSQQPFHFFENEPFHKPPNPKDESMDFIETGGGYLWVATWGGGVTIYDAHLNAKKNLIHRPGDPQSIAEPGNKVWSFIKNKDGSILMGCQHGYLSLADSAGKSIANFHPKILANRTIMNMRADDHQNIWMGLYSGFGKWNMADSQAIRYGYFIPYMGIDSATSTDLIADHFGNVWVGTLGLGVQKFEVSLNRFTEIFVPDKANIHSISSALINCMISINDSVIAIGTGTGGINIFNIRSKTFYSINTSNDLPSNNVAALYFSPPSTLWATSGNVLCKINLESRHVIRFGVQDGIQDLDFSSCHHMYRMRDGHLLIGYLGGFISFYPDSINAGGPPSDVTITGFKIFDQSISTDSILQSTDTILLNYKQNFITIQFASLSYWESNRINYDYQLEGEDKNWVNAYHARFASYTNLQGGTYRFKVRCQNSDGISSNKTTYLFIVIKPPFWKTWWFETLIGLGLAIILYALYRYRINQLLKFQLVRNEISKDLHDDVGSTLSSISILSQVAKNKMQEGQQEQSASIMSKINSYSQEMVEKMGDIVWAVHPGNDSIKDIIPRLKFFFIETCTSKDIQLHFYSDPGIEKKILPMQARKNIYLICKEAINNATKYADCRKISLEFRIIDQSIEISITDDGIGFDAIASTPGNGLTNMQARASEMKGTLTLLSRKGKTSVVLKMPVPRIR